MSSLACSLLARRSPEGHDTGYSFLAEAWFGRDPEAKPPLGTRADSFVMDTSSSDRALVAALRALLVDPLLRNSELTVDIGKKSGFWRKIVTEFSSGTQEWRVQHDAMLKVFPVLTMLERVHMSFSDVFFAAVRRSLGRALFRSAASGECIDRATGSWRAERCSSSLQEGCLVPPPTSDKTAETQDSPGVPAGDDLLAALLQTHKLDVLMAPFAHAPTCRMVTGADVLQAAGMRDRCQRLPAAAQCVLGADRELWEELSAIERNELSANRVMALRAPRRVKQRRPATGQDELSKSLKDAAEREWYGKQLDVEGGGELPILNFAMSARDLAETEVLDRACDPTRVGKSVVLGAPPMRAEEASWLESLGAKKCFRPRQVGMDVRMADLMGAVEWRRITGMTAAAGIRPLAEDSTVEHALAALWRPVLAELSEVPPEHYRYPPLPPRKRGSAPLGGRGPLPPGFGASAVLKTAARHVDDRGGRPGSDVAASPGGPGPLADTGAHASARSDASTSRRAAAEGKAGGSLRGGK